MSLFTPLFCSFPFFAATPPTVDGAINWLICWVVPISFVVAIFVAFLIKVLTYILNGVSKK